MLNLWDFSFERRSRKDAVSSSVPAFYLCPSKSIPFFAVLRPPCPFRDIWTRVVLSARHPLAQRRNYVGPRDALGPRLKKIEITPVANGSPLDPAASPWDLTPSDGHDPRSSSILLRPSTDVIGATKKILRAQIGGSWTIAEREVDPRSKKFLHILYLFYWILSFIIMSSLKEISSFKARSKKNINKYSMLFIIIIICTYYLLCWNSQYRMFIIAIANETMQVIQSMTVFENI